MSLKKSMMNALSTEFNVKGLSDPQSMAALGDIKSELKKLPETTEATASGAAGAFEPPLEGEMKEKWSEKYKKSIDCSNPRGFSQRAHCQGRKKKLKESINEAVRTELAQLKD